MKNKIAIRLMCYFTLVLLAFSFIVGIAFFYQFSNYNTLLHQKTLESRAKSIAKSFTETIATPSNHRGQHRGINAYMQFLDTMSMSNVWIIDQHMELITSGHHAAPISQKMLPPDAEEVISQVFQGQTAYSESFSGALGTKTVTVGTPIMDNNNVIGVVLLHSPVEDITDAISGGFRILIFSIIAALLLSAVLAFLFSMRFTRPLRKLKKTALLLGQMDYSAKSGIRQKDEIGELAETLDLLADRLLAASKESENLENMRQDFISNVSHELRTPVTVIRCTLEALHDKVISEKESVEECHQQMLAECLHLQRLIEDLLELSRLQNPDFTIEKKAFPLCDVIDDVVRSISHVGEKKQVAISGSYESCSCLVLGDYSRIRQLLFILLDNAIKFSPNNSTVTVNVTEQEKSALIKISDQGCGIKEKDLPYIFERFHKARSETNKSGTGLGLPIARQIAQRHGIQITVSSKIKKGTAFLLDIPTFEAKS